jgi:hypothetical protein
MFQAVFTPIIRSSNFVHSIWYMSSLFAATVSVGELALQFELLMTGGKPPETCRALTAIKNIV